jgi:uncharacterized protein (TIGR03118 family)
MNKTIGLALGLALLSSTALASSLAVQKKSPGAPPTTFQVTNLVSSQEGVANVVDPALVNSWGVAVVPHGPIWVSDQGTGVSTLYNSRTGEKQSLTVTIPGGGPTGIVQIPDDDDGIVEFPVTEGTVTGQSAFVFATTHGQIEGWNPSVDAANAIVAVDNSVNNAVYTGLGVSDGKDRLYAANFQKNQVEVYDANFHLIAKFHDPDLPEHFSPFNAKVFAGEVFVTFAERAKGGDEVTGPGLGYIDVFDRLGRLKRRLVANGALNAPWGMEIAPPNFGTFAGDLLVGNFGDGTINAYDRNTGDFLGTVPASDGNPIVLPGLWALENRPSGTLTFSAGPGDEAFGLVGSIAPTAVTAQK